MLAELLAELAGKAAVDTADGRTSCSARDVDDARGLLEAAAGETVPEGGWTQEDPLRLWKRRLAWLLHCPRRAVVVGDGGSAANLDDLLVGLLVDAAAKLLSLGAIQPVTIEAALTFLDAQGEDRVHVHLDQVGEPAAAALMAEAAARVDRLTDLWPELEPGWWPRVEEPVRVPLAGGRVVLTGRFDVLVGGPPTDRPAVVVEVKSGRWHDSVRSDAHFYGLLLALRDGVPPAAVVTVAARDGATEIELLRPAVLQHTAERVAAALPVAAALAAGEAPEARPGDHCVTCPARSSCPASTAIPEPTAIDPQTAAAAVVAA